MPLAWHGKVFRIARGGSVSKAVNNVTVDKMRQHQKGHGSVTVTQPKYTTDIWMVEAFDGEDVMSETLNM